MRRRYPNPWKFCKCSINDNPNFILLPSVLKSTLFHIFFVSNKIHGKNKFVEHVFLRLFLYANVILMSPFRDRITLYYYRNSVMWPHTYTRSMYVCVQKKRFDAHPIKCSIEIFFFSELKKSTFAY